MSLSSRLAGLAFGAAIVWSGLAVHAAPAPELTVSQWADKFRHIAPESGARFPGAWRTARVPYTREIMDVMGVDYPVRKVFVRAGAQGAKTQCMNNAIGHCIDTQPRSIMLVQPSGSKAKAYNHEQFQPMVDVTPALAAKVLPTRGRVDEGSTTTFKRFAGGFLKIVSAQTESDLQSTSIGFLCCDEIASFVPDADGRGHPVDQARERLTAWADEAKEIGVSTTGEIGNCRITEEYEAGDQRLYYTPCPQCGDYSVLTFEAMACDAAPHFVQPCCGYPVDRADLPAMLAEHPLATMPTGDWPEDWQARAGAIWIKSYPSEDVNNPAPPDVIAPADLRAWRARGSEGRHASFHFWQAQSPFSDWRDIWSKWEATKADPDKLVSFYQQVLALPYEPSMDRPKVDQLVEAIASPVYVKTARLRRGEVPEWAVILCGAADTQVDRFDCATWAFGPAEYGEASPGRPAINAALIDWETINEVPESPRAWAALSAYRNRRWPGARTEPMTHDRFGVDTGGGHTTSIYTAVAKHAGLMALKGASQPDALPIARSKNRVKLRRGAAAGQAIDLFLVGGFNLKKRFYYGINQGLASMETGRREPGAVFFPPDTPEWILRQATIEYLTPRRQGRNRDLIWEKPRNAANEHLDLAVYSFAVATTYGLDRFDVEAWRHLAESRARQDVTVSPMDAIWAGNGEEPPEAATQPRIVAQESNPGLKAEQPDWLRRMQEINRRGREGTKT